MKLRQYQTESISSAYNHLRYNDNNPVIVIPTGGGKTPVMAQICDDTINKWQGRVLILAHVKELLQQTRERLEQFIPAEMVGVYSAGLKSRDTKHPVIVAGIQSVYRRAPELGAFDLILIDEAHMIPPEGYGMYQTFLTETQIVNPKVRCIGLTATPYRMKSGWICSEDHFLNKICYEISIKDLIGQGFLSPLLSKGSINPIDLALLGIRNGEYKTEDIESQFNDNEVIEEACREIIQYSGSRKSILIFAASIAHGEHITEVLTKKYRQKADQVYGDTFPSIRQLVIDDFKNGKIKFLVNVGVLTQGFDAPNVDMVVLMRPTKSPGLYYQMVGRGFRIHPDKEDCLILDFGKNIERHGAVDVITPKKQGAGAGSCEWDETSGNNGKECPKCHSILPVALMKCYDCGYVFPVNELVSEASEEGILSGEIIEEWVKVESTNYYLHKKRGASDNAPRTLRVEYHIGLTESYSEWICFEHPGWAGDKAFGWWDRRSNKYLDDDILIEDILNYIDDGALASTVEIQVRHTSGEKWPKITGYRLGKVPEWREPGEDDRDIIPIAMMDEPEDVPF